MKSSRSAAAVSGCLVWGLVFAALSACVLPAAMMVGGFTSASEVAIRTTGSMICPKDTTPEVYSYASTSTDDNGNTVPSTAYELHCIDSSGEIVKNDPVGFAFLWMGILAGGGLLLGGVLAFALAAPAGLLIARLLNRNRKAKSAAP